MRRSFEIRPRARCAGINATVTRSNFLEIQKSTRQLPLVALIGSAECDFTSHCRNHLQLRRRIGRCIHGLLRFLSSSDADSDCTSQTVRGSCSAASEASLPASVFLTETSAGATTRHTVSPRRCRKSLKSKGLPVRTPDADDDGRSWHRRRISRTCGYGALPMRRQTEIGNESRRVWPKPQSSASPVKW